MRLARARTTAATSAWRVTLNSAVLAFAGMWIGVLAASAAAADPYAILASVKGKVQVSSKGGAPVVATFGRPLDRGDKVMVAPGGSATVYLSDGNVIELAEKSTVTIGGTVTSKSASGAEIPGGVYASVSKFVTAGSRATGLVAMSTMRGGEEAAPFLDDPRKSDVVADRPSFAWRAVPGATRYRITVSGDAGDLWNRETSSLTFAYPADAPALARDGDYLWKVEAFNDAGHMREESSVFHVLTADAAAAIDHDLKRIAESAGEATAATHYLSGSYLSGRGLYGDALRHFNELARISPESPAPHEALGNVYRAVGLMDQAAAEFQKALQLTRTP
jgi:hypothetical protein